MAMKPQSPHSIKSKIEFSALSHVACWDGDRASRERNRERSLNLLTFTACCGIKPCGQDRTLTRLSRDDKLAVLPDAWLPDLYSLSGCGGEREGVENERPAQEQYISPWRLAFAMSMMETIMSWTSQLQLSADICIIWNSQVCNHNSIIWTFS